MSEALPLKITYGDIEGKRVLKTQYNTHLYEPRCKGLPLKVSDRDLQPKTDPPH